MSRHEHDREDLLAEAAVLVPRVELAIEGWEVPLVAGLHREGGLSLYFDADTVWHFNSAGEIRRAYLAGKLYKAERGCLVSLTRERTADAVNLVRHELEASETEAILATLAGRLRELTPPVADAQGSRLRVLRQIPEGADSLPAIERALASLPIPLLIAARPNAG